LFNIWENLQDNINQETNICFRFVKSENYLFKHLSQTHFRILPGKIILLKNFSISIFAEADHYRDQYEALFKQHQQSYDNIQVLQTERDKLQEQIREIQKLSHGGQSSSSPADHAQLQPDSASSSSTPRALSPVNQVVEEPAPVPVASSSSTSSSAPAVLAGDQGAVAPPLDDQELQSAIDAAAALVRYPPVIKQPGVRQQQIRPLQPYQHQEDDFDVLNAPQQYYGQGGVHPSNSGQQEWYQPEQAASYDRRGQYNVQQIVPQVGKYQGHQQQYQQGQLLRHGDHYHVQEEQQQPRPKRQRQQQQHQQQEQYWNGFNNNEIQDFYRGHGRRDF